MLGHTLVVQVFYSPVIVQMFDQWRMPVWSVSVQLISHLQVNETNCNGQVFLEHILAFFDQLDFIFLFV